MFANIRRLLGILLAFACRKSTLMMWVIVLLAYGCPVQAMQHIEGVLKVDRRIVQGSQAMVTRLIQATQIGKGTINMAFIERLNATFRMRLNNLARHPETLVAGYVHRGLFLQLL